MLICIKKLVISRVVQGFLKRLWWQQNECNYIPIFWSASTVYENRIARLLHEEIYCVKYLKFNFLKLYPQEKKSKHIFLQITSDNHACMFGSLISLHFTSLTFLFILQFKWIWRKLGQNEDRVTSFGWMKKITTTHTFVECAIRNKHTS